MTVVRIDKVSIAANPFLNRSISGCRGRKSTPDGASHLRAAVSATESRVPEVQAVNAMYTHGLLAIISTKNATAALPARWACVR